MQIKLSPSVFPPNKHHNEIEPTFTDYLCLNIYDFFTYCYLALKRREQCYLWYYHRSCR